MPHLPAFKAYDIRGRLPDELNRDLAYRIGVAYAELIGARRIVVGQDCRLSSPDLTDALTLGLQDCGIEVLDIGMCGTEEVYFACFHYALDGGVMVTASHNPLDYNGMKLVREGARPISGDTGLKDIEARVAGSDARCPDRRPERVPLAHRAAYVEHLLSYVDVPNLRPLKIVSNPGNGCAGLVMDALAPHLPFEIIRVHHQPDGHFPNGIPNPLLPENRSATAEAVRSSNADFGIAWDGDFDRCFLFDEQGEFIEGYYIVGLLAQALLLQNPGAGIVHDPRLTWNTLDLVQQAGGQPLLCKSGHAFIKEKMRAENALYGGEMSAHHYFREFAYCDNGNIPWLLVAALMSRNGQPLSALVNERIAKFPSSGEINRKVADAQHTISALASHYGPLAQSEDRTDGLSLEFADWRFNLRASNTEPVIRLNVESRGNAALMHQRTEELLARIDS